MMPLPQYALAYNRDEDMWPQTADWTCAACSLAWLNRALGIGVATTEFDAADYIGNPDNINPTYGLMDGSGARLAECLREQGAPAFCGWLPFEDAYLLAVNMPLLIGGAQWYHWVGVRYAEGGDLVLANSAIGWMDIGDSLSNGDWDDLGPFAVVAVPLLRYLPPPPAAGS